MVGERLKCCHLPEQHPSPGSHANCAGGSECARHRLPLPLRANHGGFELPLSKPRRDKTTSRASLRCSKNLPHKTMGRGCQNHIYVWHIKGLQSSASVSNIGCQDLFEEHLLRASLWHQNLLPKMPTKSKRAKTIWSLHDKHCHRRNVTSHHSFSLL